MARRLTTITLFVVVTILAMGIATRLVPPSWLAYAVPAAVVLLSLWAVIVAGHLASLASRRLQLAAAVAALSLVVLGALTVLGSAIPLLMFAALSLSLLSGVVLGVQWLRRRSWNRSGLWLLGISAAVLAASSGGLWLSLILAPPPLPAGHHNTEEELGYLVQSDRQDRRTGRFIFTPRDAARHRRVLALYEQGAIQSPESKYHAALVLQHGTCPAHFGLAYELAREALDEGYQEAAWLSQATYDRWQLSLGNPQQYGTQVGSPRVNQPCY